MKLLFTSVCKPIGPEVGDAPSVGYELLHGQVTRAQHIYSPRVVHKQFSLDYIAHNLDTPSVVLHYPSKHAFIREIKKGYDVIGIAFVLSTHHHMIEMCRLIRSHATSTKIVLGGYGTIMKDEELFPHGDSICREEGVGFMRRYLGEPALPIEQYRHPDIRSRLTLFGLPVAHTAMIFAGLGCPNGCDFCCTSHFFKRKHIRLLPTGEAIFNTMAAHQKKYPEIEFTIIDEDFLLNKKRADAFLHLCRERGRSFSTFCFASVKALSQFTCDELLEMGIDGVWVGYEGKESGYDKHHGRNIDELIQELQDHGITVLSSMIIGIPYQTEAIARKEFSGLMADRPALSQFLIYGPIPGTPFYDKVVAHGLLDDEMLNDRARYYKKCTGFAAMVKHPFMKAEAIEALQEEFYQADFHLLGPSMFRVAQVKLNGFATYKNHPNPLLKRKANEFRSKLARFLAILPTGMVGPKIRLANRLLYVRQCVKILRITSPIEWLYLFLAPMMMLAAGVSLLIRQCKLMEHPITRYHHYFGMRSVQAPARYISAIWNRLHRRYDRASVACWRTTAWSLLMSFRCSPRLVVPKMDILESWMAKKKSQLGKKAWAMESMANCRAQIESTRLHLIRLSSDYHHLKESWRSRSDQKVKDLKTELQRMKKELIQDMATISAMITLIKKTSEGNQRHHFKVLT